MFQTPQINDLQTLFDMYISECEYTRQLRPQTIVNYKEVFTNFLKVMPEVRTTNDLHPHIFNEFFKRISTRKRIVGRGNIKIGVRPSTTKSYYNRLIAFIRWLESYGYIEKHDLSTKIIKPPEPVYDDERALTNMEVSRIVSSIALGSIQNQYLYKRDLVIVSLLLYTGIRKGELLGLRVQDINFEKRILFINGATSKSKKSRNIPLHFSLITHLKSYLLERKQKNIKCPALILSSKTDDAFTDHGLKYWVKKYEKLSGIKFHIHRFRHTFACNLAKTNADIVSIMNVMGHSTIRMTERYLRSIKPENSRSFIEDLSY